MKGQIHSLIVMTCAALLTTGSTMMAADQKPPAELSTREAMRAKLGYAQKVLEGLALENYSQIETNANKLARLAQVAGWRARQTPEYELFTNEFRRQADALVEAAQAKNVDGAMLAYMQLTFSCVSCHRYMRDLKAARAEPGALRLGQARPRGLNSPSR